MAFVLIVIGLMVFISAIRGTTKTLGSLLVSDFISTGGQASFLYWIVAIMVVGGLGYIKAIRPLANAFLALLILVLFLANKGFFDQFNSALKSVAGGATGTVTTNLGVNTGALSTTFSSLGITGQAVNTINYPFQPLTPNMSITGQTVGRVTVSTP